MNLKKLQTAAHFISYITHPLLMPLWVIILAVYTNPYIFDKADTHAIVGLLLIVFTNFIVYPALSFVLMLRLKLINSAQLDKSKERIIPFVATGLFYIWGYEVIKKSGVPILICKPLLGVVIALFTANFINMFTKVSLHSIGIAGLVTAAIILNTYSVYNLLPFITVGILIAGIMGSARYIVHAHTLQQIMLGTFVGAISMIVGFYI